MGLSEQFHASITLPSEKEPLVVPRAGLTNVEERTFFCPCRESNEVIKELYKELKNVF
jgi:hypothetical protein